MPGGIFAVTFSVDGNSRLFGGGGELFTPEANRRALGHVTVWAVATGEVLRTLKNDAGRMHRSSRPMARPSPVAENSMVALFSDFRPASSTSADEHRAARLRRRFSRLSQPRTRETASGRSACN